MFARFICLLIIACVTWVGVAGGASAQLALPSGTKSADATSVPDLNELSEEQIYELLSRIDEKQVRKLLLTRLVDDAKKRAAAAAAADNRLLSQITREYATAFGTFISDVVAKVPAIPGAITDAFTNYQERRGDVPVWRLLLSIVVSRLLCSFMYRAQN